jgi:hypothetical protein
MTIDPPDQSNWYTPRGSAKFRQNQSGLFSSSGCTGLALFETWGLEVIASAALICGFD